MAGAIPSPPRSPTLPRPDAVDDSALDALPLLGHTLEELEREAIRQTLERLAGREAVAARELGISLATLRAKVRKHGLDTKPATRKR